MEIAQHVTAIEQEAHLFADAARRSELDAVIATCPGWDMRDLVRHLAEIHLCAAAQVSNRAAKMWVKDLCELSAYWPDLALFWPSDDELIDWYLQTNANLVRELTSAPLDLRCRTFLPASSPLAMWARRQAHETAVHRFDAEHAGHTGTSFEPGFAADGIDELLVAFATRGSTFAIGSPGRIVVHTNDTDDRWHVTGVTTTRGEGPCDVTITGSASALYLTLWNRSDHSTITVTGNRDLLDTWRNGHRIRWSRAHLTKERTD